MLVALDSCWLLFFCLIRSLVCWFLACFVCSFVYLFAHSLLCCCLWCCCRRRRSQFFSTEFIGLFALVCNCSVVSVCAALFCFIRSRLNVHSAKCQLEPLWLRTSYTLRVLLSRFAKLHSIKKVNLLIGILKIQNGIQSKPQLGNNKSINTRTLFTEY